MPGERAGCRRERVAEGRGSDEAACDRSHRSVVARARCRRAATHIGRVNDPARMISPASSRAPCWCELVREPGDARGGVVEHAGGDAGLLDLAVAVEQRRAPSAGRSRRAACASPPSTIAPIGGVVGDRVDDRAALELDVRVEDLERGHGVVDRARARRRACSPGPRAAPSARTRARPRCARSRTGRPGSRRRSR